MCKSLSVALLLGALCASARADISVAIPAPTTTLSTRSQVGVDDTSAGALAIKDQSGATYYIGHASTGQLSETSAGELSLNYSLKYDAADGDYGTATGILLPITPEWDITDLSAMTSLTFEAKMATTGAKIHLIIGSDAYPADMAKENSALVGNDVSVTTAYATITVLPGDLLVPTWAKAPGAATTAWIASGTYTTGIAPAVKSLNFQPVLNWTSATVLKSDAASKNTLTIRNVKIAGLVGPKLPIGSQCLGSHFVLDDFAADRMADGPDALGTYWYAFTDTTSDRVRNDTDSAVGRSKVALPSGAAKWTVLPGMGAFLSAKLEKNDTGSAFLYHRYAGWAAIGTDLTGTDGSPSALFQGNSSLRAISFDLYAGASAAPAIPGATFATDKVKTITFKVGMAGVPDAVAFQASIPSDTAVAGWTGNHEGLTSVCVDLTSLSQPSWYVKTLAGGASPIDPAAVTKLSWEAKITDQKDPTVHSADVTFGVGNVTLWGVDPTSVKGSRIRSEALRVAAGNQLVLSYEVPGSSARIEIVRFDGTRVASFDRAGTAKDLALPLRLAPGNYLVSVAGGGRRLVQAVSAAR
jgi:hypothetical protein